MLENRSFTVLNYNASTTRDKLIHLKKAGCLRACSGNRSATKTDDVIQLLTRVSLQISLWRVPWQCGCTWCWDDTGRWAGPRRTGWAGTWPTPRPTDPLPDAVSERSDDHSASRRTLANLERKVPLQCLDNYARRTSFLELISPNFSFVSGTERNSENKRCMYGHCRQMM